MTQDIKRILYATDLSDNSAYAFGYAIDLAKKYNAEITILHVLDIMMGMSANMVGVYFNEKQETKAGLSFPNPNEEWTLGYPHEIQDFMEAIAYDRDPLTGLDLAMQLVEVLYAGYVSCEEGRRISLV